MKEKTKVQQMYTGCFPLACALVVFLVTVSCCGSVSEVSAESGHSKSITCRYAVLLDGKRVGETVSTREGKFFMLSSTVRIEATTKIQANGLWGTWSLESMSMVEQNQLGIIRFDHKVTVNQDKWHLFGEKYKQSLWCSARKVQTKEEKEEENAIGVAKHVAAKTIPFGGETLMVLDLLGGGDDEQGDVAVPLDTFDTTLSGLPACLLRIKQKEEKQLKILDTSELKVESVVVTAKGSEQITLAGQQFFCMIFYVKAKNGHSTYWVAEDSLGAFIVKEQGKDADGPFALNLYKYEKQD